MLSSSISGSVGSAALSLFLREKIAGWACFVLATMPAGCGQRMLTHPAHMRHARHFWALSKTLYPTKNTLADYAERNYPDRHGDANRSAWQNNKPPTLASRYNNSYFDIRCTFIESTGACFGRTGSAAAWSDTS